MSKKAIALFIIIAYAISFVYIWIFYNFYKYLPNKFVNLVLGLVMFGPTVAAFLSLRIVYKTSPKNALAHLGLRFDLRSILLGILTCFVMAVVYLPIIAIFIKLGFIKPHFENIKKLINTPIPWGLALLIGIVNGISITTIFALGEEIGWRGFLYKELSKYTNNLVILSIIIGIIWAFWHFPLLYLFKWTYPYLGLALRCAMFSIFCVLLTMVLLWLRMVSDSVLPCAIVHAFVNTYYVIFFIILGGGILGALGLPVFMDFLISFYVIKILLNKIEFFRLNGAK